MCIYKGLKTRSEWFNPLKIENYPTQIKKTLKRCFRTLLKIRFWSYYAIIGYACFFCFFRKKRTQYKTRLTHPPFSITHLATVFTMKSHRLSNSPHRSSSNGLVDACVMISSSRYPRTNTSLTFFQSRRLLRWLSRLRNRLMVIGWLVPSDTREFMIMLLRCSSPCSCSNLSPIIFSLSAIIRAFCGPIPGTCSCVQT